MKKIKCFVAMAFGRDDVNLIFQNNIKPVLQNLNFSVRQMEELIHNTRVDQKIIEEIKEADILIADLTYARPSVYWEAGFAEGRKIPVIYTVRDDHFKDKFDDIYGNLKVHFDLQNAPIIPWHGKGDDKFRKSLSSRLVYISKPLQFKKEKKIQNQVEREKFSMLSIHERISLVDNSIRIPIESNGFTILDNKFWRGISTNASSRIFEIKFPTYIKKHKTTFINLITANCLDNLLKKDLDGLNLNISLQSNFPLESICLLPDCFTTWENAPDYIKSFTRRSIKSIRNILLLPSLQNIPSSRIEKTFSGWRKYSAKYYYLPKYKYYAYDSRFTSKKLKHYLPKKVVTPTKEIITPVLPTSSEIIFFDKILSIDDLLFNLDNFISEIQDITITTIKPEY